MIVVPDYVVHAMEAVRETGKTNMYDRHRVATIAFEVSPPAALWIMEHKNDYVWALEALGELLDRKHA